MKINRTYSLNPTIIKMLVYLSENSRGIYKVEATKSAVIEMLILEEYTKITKEKK